MNLCHIVAAANVERDVVVYSTVQWALETPASSYDYPGPVLVQTSLAFASVEELVEDLVPCEDNTRSHRLRGTRLDPGSVLGCQ